LKSFIIIGSLLCALSVVLGAFGSHGLKSKLSIDQLVVYETATRYLMYHAIGLFLIGVLSYNLPANSIRLPGIIMFFGVLIFSGSLYIVSLKKISYFGMVAPIGGMALIISWVLLAINVYKIN
tara:strand:+ start:121 stop:489 length:369 start_codon:yes stop_codon:yes gene_type:complete